MAENKGGAEKPVTLDDLRTAFNALGVKFNELLAAFQEGEARQAGLETSVREIQAVQRDAALRPGAGGVAGGDASGPLLQQILADIAELKGRPIAPMTSADVKAAQAAALVREAHNHQGDRMMYHKDPGHGKPSLVVRTDAEEKQAALDGYYPSLRAAAQAGLDGKASEREIVARMELLKKGMFRGIAA